jgi:Na+/proline symporter
MLLIIASIIISVFFIGVAFYHKRTIKSLKDFFFYKIPDNKRKLTISLIAANLTLGTGLVYLAQGGFSNGILFLLVPVSLWIGYFLLSKFIEYINFNSESNFFEFIDDKISNNQTKSIFKKAITFVLLITFILVLSYEIFASSTILSPLIFNSNELFYQIIISFFIIVVALIYTIISGMKGVIMNDIFQIILIILALSFLIFGNQSITFENAVTNIQSKITLSSPIIWFTVILASINAISTQFYSILNHGIITNAYATDRNSILRKTGIYSGLLISLFILFGLMLPGDNSIINFTTLLINSYGKIALVIIILGFLSIIYSTLDSLLIIISMFFYKNILNKEITSDNNKKDINNVRAIISFSFIFIFILLAFFYYYTSDLFYLLLGIGSGISVVVPLILLAGYLFKINKITLLKNSHIWMYVVLFVIAHIVYLYAITYSSFQSYLPFLSYTFLAISIIYTLYLLKIIKNG